MSKKITLMDKLTGRALMKEHRNALAESAMAKSDAKRKARLARVKKGKKRLAEKKAKEAETMIAKS